MATKRRAVRKGAPRQGKETPAAIKVDRKPKARPVETSDFADVDILHGRAGPWIREAFSKRLRQH